MTQTSDQTSAQGAVPARRPLIARPRQAVRAATSDFVRWGALQPGERLPAVCEAAQPGLDLPSWLQSQRDDIRARLLVHGAILFRGFPVADAAGFNACVDAVSGGALRYQFRASPRTQIQGGLNVYTSTDYPSQERIFPHNEHSYSPVFPLHLYFFCHTPSPVGGETPLGDTRVLLSRIRPDIREAFLERKIMYVRNYGDGFGLPWRTVFQTDDPREVERYAESVGIEVEWKSGDRLRTRQVGPAVVKHPATGEAVWFNHGTFFNELTLPASVRESLRREFAPEDLPQNTFYGDGAPIETDTVLHLQAAYQDVMLAFPWQRGDVVLLDNILTLHARNAYDGPRRIMTAMAESCRSADVDIANFGATHE